MASSLPALPAILSPALTGRDAIADAIYRSVLGLDTDDVDLFKSAFAADAVFDLNGTVMTGLDAIVRDCYTNISKMDTNHYIANMRVHVVEPEAKAHVTCSALAQHYRPGEGMKGGTPLLAGSLYWVELVKDSTSKDGLWKVTHWRLKANWGHGDWAVFGQP